MRKITVAAFLMVFTAVITSCSGAKDNSSSAPSNVYYEIFVRSFADSNGDGIGDLKGIEGKLDYLQELGVDGLWLTPIQPSPSYHGYDVTDFYGINPEFGTMDDYKSLLTAAHKRGMKVLMDLVVNHTSADHPWFKDSASSKSSAHRKWYTWAEDKDLSTSAMSATGGEAWHLSSSGHYEATFWEGMPDLNFDEPAVRQEMIKIGNYWLDQGVDGFRLDAAKHIYEDFKTSTNNPSIAKKNQKWWQEFSKGVTASHPNAYLVGEVWSSPGAIVPFVKDALDSTFNFDLSDWIRSSVVAGQASNMPSQMEKYYEVFKLQSNGKYMDAPFLDNHDRDRFMSLAKGDMAKAKLAASMLLTMPGRPFVYYGEEIGMQGAGADEQKREPMRWTKSSTGEGQTSWESDVSNTDQGVSVEAQKKDKDSLFIHYKDLIALRKKLPGLRSSAIKAVPDTDSHIAAYVRGSDKEAVYVAHNLSGEPRVLALDAESAALFKKIVYNSSGNAVYQGGKLSIPAYGSVVLK